MGLETRGKRNRENDAPRSSHTRHFKKEKDKSPITSDHSSTMDSAIAGTRGSELGQQHKGQSYFTGPSEKLRFDE